MAKHLAELDIPLAQLTALAPPCVKDLTAHVLVTGASRSGKTVSASHPTPPKPPAPEPDLGIDR